VTRILATCLAAAALACGQVASSEGAIRQMISQGRYTEAESLARSALADAEARSGAHSKDVAEVLDDLLEILYYSSRVRDPGDQALASRSVALSEELFGPASPELAKTLRLAGEFARHNGDYERARPLLRRAIDIHEAIPDAADSLQERAEAWSSMASLLRDAFDYQGAKADLERALPLYEQAVGRQSLPVAVCLNSLASTLTRLGDYNRAKALFEEALRVYEATVGPDHIMTAGCLNNLAFLLTESGHPAEAAELLRKALRIATATYGERHPRIGSALSNLADALSASGKYDAAASYYERAAEIRTTIFGPVSPEIAASLDQRAVNAALAGKSALAAELAIQAEDISRSFDLIAIRTMPEREALLRMGAKASGQRLSGLNTLLSLAAAGAPGGPALDALIRSRGVVFDEMASRRRAIESGSPEIAGLAEGLAAAREELAKLVMRGPKSMTASQYEAALNRARENKYGAERLLAEKSLPFRRELTSRQTGLSEVAAALPKDAAMISFIRYPRAAFRLGAPARNPAANAQASYLALVLRPGQSQPAVVDLGTAAEVDALVAQLRHTISQEAQDPGRAPQESEASYRRAAERLRLRIWDPLAPHWKGAARLFVVPDGSLHLVSFAALPAGRGYQIESGPAIHYLSVERDMVAGAPSAEGHDMLLVAGPAFDGGPALASSGSFRGATAACSAYQSLHFTPLPGAAREAASVSAIWRESGGAESSLIGTSARKSSVLEQAAGKRVLHLATHGFFLDGCGPAAGATPASATGALDNPLLLSGLALAGANESKQPGEGILTAEEIASLHLDGLEWVVLSACDTALGEIHAGEGVFGLRRAFQLAGARTVIMSLWQVDDNTTRLWMEELYRARFLRGAATSEAIRTATLSVLANRRAAHLGTHPLYWAGFLAVGEWR
jgi:CHAT domain-containing protein/Tfp pilus assembly protein PilF